MSDFFTKHRLSLTLKETSNGQKGFRICQLGAIWAAKSHFTASNERALISLPTGAGKTAVMMTLAFELGARRVFILTPSQLVRDQTAREFETLDQLFDDIEAIPKRSKFGPARPKVLEIKNELRTDAQWKDLLSYEVVVATPNVVRVSHPPAEVFSSNNPDDAGFDLVFVDEGHHSAAETWYKFLTQVGTTRTVLFTATPFRRDRKRIRAKPIYVYPISKAIKDGIYSEIRFEPVVAPDPNRRDAQLAARCRALFLEEKKKNPNLAIIVRAKGIGHAETLRSVYKKAGFKERMGIIHSELSLSDNREVLRKVLNNTGDQTDPNQLDGFICVDIGSEGIDVPNLGMAVFHDAPRTLPYTIQIIGRVTRTGPEHKGAAILIADEAVTRGTEVQDLYNSDQAWSDLLPNLFAEYINRAKFLPTPGSMLGGAISLPEDDLNPYLTVRVYQKTQIATTDEPFISGFDEYELHRKEIDVEVFDDEQPNRRIVITRSSEVPNWTSHRAFETDRFDLHIYCHVRTLVFECTTAERIAGRIRSKLMDERSFPRADYKLIRNGLSDALGGHFFMLGMAKQTGGGSGTPQYKVLLGEDVQDAVKFADGRSFSAGHAVMTKNGKTRGVAIQTRRIWSNARKGLADFQKWCEELADLVLGPPKRIPQIDNKLMEPETITSYPAKTEILSIVFDSAFWPVNRVLILLEGETIVSPNCVFENWQLDRSEVKITVDLVIKEQNATVPTKTLKLEHSLSAPFWKLIPSTTDVRVVIDYGDPEEPYSKTLAEYLQDSPPFIVLSSGATIRDEILYKPKIQNQRLEPDLSEEKDWVGTDITKEAKPPDPPFGVNVQERTVKIIQAQYYLGGDDFLICDDRANEVADFVLIQAGLLKKISFFHCKYKLSKSSVPGVSRIDITELIDQGVRTGHWIRAASLVNRLWGRLAGLSQLVHGDRDALESLSKTFSPDEWTYAVILVQPGLSKRKLVTSAMASQAEQLLIVIADRITTDYGANFAVWVNS